MEDRPHTLVFMVRGSDWQEIEREAAKVIRRYTNRESRGRNAVSDMDVLGSAEFTSRPASFTVWESEVRITV